MGRDGEKAISKAVHLHCKGNLDFNLREIAASKHERVEFLRDVFSNPEKFETELVDVDTNESDYDMFETKVLSLKAVWDGREQPYSDPHLLFEWFVQNCKT